MKQKMQKAYDTLKTQEEGVSRVVLYLNHKTLEKIQKLAKDEGRLADKVVDEVLNNFLL